jgi:hypothetical protein
MMWVGRDYSMESFISEANKLGVSKRIATVPKDFVVGRDWVLLARKNAGEEETGLRIVGKKVQKTDVIFFAFKPTAIEYLVTEAEAKDEEFIEKLVEQGITPVLEVEPDHRDICPIEEVSE